MNSASGKGHGQGYNTGDDFEHGRGSMSGEPKTFLPSKMYDIAFCRQRADEWTTSGKWEWKNNKCVLASRSNDYNMAWMGQRDPESLQWNDYRCTVTFTYDNTNIDVFSRSLITYAAASDSTFERLNGYYCTVERYAVCALTELPKTESTLFVSLHSSLQI